GVELYCSEPTTQWWFVASSPSGETKEAVQLPSETIAPIGWPVRSANAWGSPSKPSARSLSASAGTCWGIHMPSSAAVTAAASTAAATKEDELGVRMSLLARARAEAG